MAEVFEAFLLGEGGFERRVALKRLLPEVAEDDVSAQRFLDEARIAGSLHHPNVAAVLDMGVLEGVPFLISELVDGLDLRSLEEEAGPASGPIPFEIALHVVCEVAAGLHHAHRAVDTEGRPLGIVHRDVSPENIMVSWQGDVKLIDFGIAHALSRLAATRVGGPPGKLSYMAPEQTSQGTVDPRTDVFALGCVLHWLLSGESPIEGGRRAELDPAIDPRVRPIVERAIQQNQAQRYPSAAALASDIKKLGASASRQALVEWMAAVERAQRPRKDPASERQRLDLFELALVQPSESGEPSNGATTRSFVAKEIDPTPVHTPRTEQDPMIGTVLHGFRIEQLLDQGASARLYRASHNVLPREYAVKVIHDRLLVDDNAVERFTREAKILSKLSHPHLVSVADVGTTTAGRPFIAMEFLHGRSLRAAIKEEGPFAPERAARITRHVALGLAEVHRHGLVHRDLKPANIMLVDPNEVAKVLDFGIARDTGGGDDYRTRLTRQGQILGTPAFMAPEQIRGASTVGPPADLYALGGVICAMLTGEPPFGRGIAEAIEGHLTGPLPVLPDAGGLEILALRLLAKDPAARPRSALEVLAEIDRLDLASTEPGEVQEPTEVPTTPEAVVARPAAPGRTLPPAATPHTGPTLNTLRPTVENFVPRARALIFVLGAATLFVLGALFGRFSSRSEQDAPVVVQEAAPEVRSPIAVGTARPSPPPPAAVEPPADPVEPANKARPLRTSKAPRPKKDEPSVEPQEPDAERWAFLDRSVKESLAARGLRNLDDLEALAPDSKAPKRWKAARAARNLAEAQGAADAAKRDLEELSIDLPLLRAISERIKKRMESLPPERAASLEQAYLDLKKTIGPGLNATARTHLALELLDFERSLR
jgi:serine/threonine-protein kinase